MSYPGTSYTNGYKIFDGITEYQAISTEREDDWMAKWIWDKENLTEKNVWMCFTKWSELMMYLKNLLQISLPIQNIGFT